MKIRRLISFLLLAGFLALPTQGFGDASLHGIRNKKCQPDEQEAKTAIFELLRTVKELCPMGNVASQAEGWTCRRGDCPKGKIRCNTQYRCGSSETQQLSNQAQAPAQMAQPKAEPQFQAQPQFQPKGRGPTPGKREFMDNGVTYIEETSVDAKGILSTSTYPKGEANNQQPNPAPGANVQPPPVQPTQPAEVIQPEGSPGDNSVIMSP